MTPEALTGDAEATGPHALTCYVAPPDQTIIEPCSPKATAGAALADTMKRDTGGQPMAIKRGHKLMTR